MLRIQVLHSLYAFSVKFRLNDIELTNGLFKWSFASFFFFFFFFKCRNVFRFDTNYCTMRIVHNGQPLAVKTELKSQELF